MGRIEDIISQLNTIAENPAKAIEDYKKATGKGAVGVMPLYVPEEIIHAAGYLPVGMWGARKKEISRARTYLPPFACSIMQSVMELQLEGVYDILDTVIFSVPCDTLKCMSQKWHGKAPAIVFTHPQNRKLEAANRFLTTEFEILKNKLENNLHVTITEEAMNQSIAVYNENRWFMEKSAHTAIVRELITEIKKNEKKPWTGKKVVLTGILLEDEVLEILKENAFAVAADDLAQESRQFRHDVPEGGSALQRLAAWWQQLEGCALAGDTKKVRGQMLINSVHEHHADAVLVCMMKFCDPEEFDYPIYYQELENAGIRNLMIEVDQESTAFEQIRTCLQTFDAKTTISDILPIYSHFFFLLYRLKIMLKIHRQLSTHGVIMERYDVNEMTPQYYFITTKRKGLYMDVDREQLQKLREQIGRKAHLESMLDNLYVQEKEQKEKVEELRQEKEDEQKDVDRLEDRGLTALFYSLIGKIDEKMTKEQKEAYAASVKYEAASQELKAIQYHIDTYMKELDYLKGCEETYNELLKSREAEIRSKNSDKAEQLLHLDERISACSSRIKELQEAISAGQKAAFTTECVLGKLDSAEAWGTWDILGGGLLSTAAKHGNLDDAQSYITELQMDLRHFNTELTDISVQTDIHVNTDDFLRFADYFFDGIFADLAVQKRIKQSKEQVQGIKTEIESVLEELERMLDEEQHLKETLQSEIEDVLVE